MTLTVGSLFSGIGGIDLGFERAGAKVLWQCEIDKHARKILARRFPGAAMYEDVKDVGYEDPSVDVVVGGFPCQDVSVAGRRAGLAGERSGLWFEFHRILRSLRPRWCVIENVPGLLSSNGGADFAVILRGLVELGYSVAWRILDAQYFGVAQRRRRVFIVGSLGDGRAAEVLFEREGVPGHPPARRAAGEGTPYDVAPGLTASGRGTERAGDSRGQDCLVVAGAEPRADAVDLRAMRSGGMGDDAGRVADTLRQADDGGLVPDLADCLTASYADTKSSAGNNPRPVNVVVVPDRVVANPLGSSRGGPRLDLDNDTYVVDTLRSHPRPGSNTTGAIVFDPGSDPIAAEGYVPHIVGALDSEVGGNKLTHQSAANGHLLGTMTARMFNALGARDVEEGAIQVTTSGVRRLTPVECERLQGFPDGWTEDQADSNRYRQLGNAVCVPVAEWIARRIVACS